MTYSGSELHSEEFIYWKVQVWDKDSIASGWSETQHWSMGLLNPSDWKGKWIGLDKDVGDDNSSDEFRRLSAGCFVKNSKLKSMLKMHRLLFVGWVYSNVTSTVKRLGTKC